MLRHGMTGTRFWGIYQSVRQRCSKYPGKNVRWYSNIECHWKTFEDFRDDMWGSYLRHVDEFGEKDTTLERINNKKGYSKENCRWATRAEQARNTSQNHWLNYMGETRCLTDWSRLLGFGKTTITMRLKRGWTTEQALSTPIGGRH